MENFVKDYLNAVCQTQITAMEVFMGQQENKGYFIIDVRIAPVEYLGEKIVGSNYIPLNELMNNVGNIPTDKDVLVYTWNAECTLAKKALLMLAEVGVVALEISGGVTAWKNAQLPLEKIEG